MNLDNVLTQARSSAARFLDSVACSEGEASFYRTSATHDPRQYFGQLLYGTWSGVFISALLQRASDFAEPKRSHLAAGLNRFQREDGYYIQPDIPDANRGGHDDEYLTLHFSNYALGAIRLLKAAPRFPLSFIEQYASPKALEKWLISRKWHKPWTEGNNVVNLASFYQMLAMDGEGWAKERLEEMADWHDANQNPATGYWHSDRGETFEKLHNAMAGAAHNLHIYYCLDRDVPNPSRVIDSTLSLCYRGIRSACIDIDLVDILVHFRRYKYRLQEIERMLEFYLVELLQVQNSDGGFSDSYVAAQEVYGHTSGPWVSVTWTTWFRLATLGMIVCTFFPEERQRWTFRDTIGMGYCNLDHAQRGVGTANFSLNRDSIPAALRMKLSAVRNVRFARQHLTWRARQWLGKS
jgi:hypothetical protein